MPSTARPTAAPATDRFVEAAGRSGSVAESDLERLAETSGLDDAAVDDLRERLVGAHVTVDDDCGRPAPPTVRLTNGDLVEHTVDALAQFLNEVGRHPLLDRQQEVELAKRIERGDLSAKEQMINSNLRLVVHVARKYRGVDMPLLDVIQEGVIGLIRAAEKFDWRKGFKFSTYATLWIRQSIGRALDDKTRAIRLPLATAQRERKVATAYRNLSARLGRHPSDEELAEACGMTIDDLERLEHAARVVTSLDKPVDEAGETALGALLAADGPDAYEQVEVALTARAIRDAVEGMPEAEREIIELRYGLEGADGPLTHRQVARRLGVGYREVQQLERRGLAELALRRELQSLAA